MKSGHFFKIRSPTNMLFRRVPTTIKSMFLGPFHRLMDDRTLAGDGNFLRTIRKSSPGFAPGFGQL